MGTLKKRSYNFEKKFSKILKNLRLKNGFSQAELAAKINVAYSTIACLESGLRLPSLRVAIKLSKEFGVPVDDLYKTEPCNG